MGLGEDYTQFLFLHVIVECFFLWFFFYNIQSTGNRPSGSTPVTKVHESAHISITHWHLEEFFGEDYKCSQVIKTKMGQKEHKSGCQSW
jgi:hypothetical protein